MDKKVKRIRRGKRTRAKIRSLDKVRLTVHRTSQHIYAQLIASGDNKVLAAASTLDKSVRDKLKNGSNITAAKAVGALIAERGLAVGLKEVAFDRSGLRYHGRVKALADSARQGGMEF